MLTAPIDTCAVKAANPPSRAALGNGLPTWRCATSVAGTVIRWSPPHRDAQRLQTEFVEGPRAN